MFQWFSCARKDKGKNKQQTLTQSIGLTQPVYLPSPIPRHTPPPHSPYPSSGLLLLSFLLYHAPSYPKAFAHLPGRLFLGLSISLVPAQPYHHVLKDMVPDLPDKVKSSPSLPWALLVTVTICIYLYDFFPLYSLPLDCKLSEGKKHMSIFAHSV